MADLTCTIAGITSPNPFWLASAPPTDKRYNVERAFEAGWGGVVWKTLGEDGPPIVNVSSRYGSVDFGGQRMMAIVLAVFGPSAPEADEKTAAVDRIEIHLINCNSYPFKVASIHPPVSHCTAQGFAWCQVILWVVFEHSLGFIIARVI